MTSRRPMLTSHPPSLLHRQAQRFSHLLPKSQKHLVGLVVVVVRQEGQTLQMPQKATPFLERLRLSCSPLTAHRQEASQQAQQSQQASSPSGMSCRGEGRVEGGTRTRRDATQSLFLPSRSFDASDENRLALLSQGLEKLSAGSSPRFGPKAGRVTSRLHDHATATRTETDSTHLLASCLRAACFVRARAAAWGPSLSHLLIVSEGTFPSFVWMDEYKAGLSRTETNAPTAITTVASIALMKSKSWGKPPERNQTAWCSNMRGSRRRAWQTRRARIQKKTLPPCMGGASMPGGAGSQINDMCIHGCTRLTCIPTYIPRIPVPPLCTASILPRSARTRSSMHLPHKSRQRPAKKSVSSTRIN